MSLIRRFRWPLAGLALAVAIAAFLAFRPDKLFVDDRVDESLDDAFASAVETTSTSAASAAVGETPTTAPDATTTTTTTVAADPVAVSSGAFYGIDHSATGTATVYEQDGRFVLRFEDDTDIQNGPDLYVWVLAEPDYGGGQPTDYLDLGTIKGNVGGQNYDLPAEFDPAVHRSVLVWCLRFTVPFAAAPLQ